jgi:hypothetical protein
MVSERRGWVIAQLTAAVEEGGSQNKINHTPPVLTAEGIVGGVLAVLQARLSYSAYEPSPTLTVGDGLDGGGGLIGLTNPLMAMIVLPYLGSAAARRELQRPLPALSAHRSGPPLLSDPFKDAGIRLTYRTVRVLLALAEHDGASNRQVGEAAGIGDQGQISKLLGRLQRIGLASNAGLGPGKGGPNAWTLTGKGQRLVDSISAHAEDLQ